jgi:ABC-type sugar transport system ATPase subunit
LRRVSKSFGARRALTEVDFAVFPGEVHAVAGENGAGKSTLLNVMTGVVGADAGEMFWQGRPVRLRHPREACDLGITFVHQEPALVPQLTAAENVFLGRHPARLGWVRWREINRQAAGIFEELGHRMDPHCPLAGMSLAERQLVEVARALAFDARLIVLDEPTAALAEKEAQRLRAAVQRLCRRGIGFVLVSHRLQDVFALAHRVTVLRDGKRVLTLPASQIGENELVRAMAGPDIQNRAPQRSHRRSSGEALRVQDPVELAVGHGEIVGLTGAAGSGCSTLLERLFGADPQRPARVVIGGCEVTLRSPRDAIRHGFALVPDDRTAKGLIPGSSLAMNIVLAGNRNRFFIDKARETRQACELIAKLRIRADGPDAPVSWLSGGNQQKAILARWLLSGAGIFLLDEPTRGVDLRSKAQIYEWIDRLAASGAAVLMASSDVEELLRIAHRIVVMERGRIAGELLPADATAERILHLATGGGA